MKTIKNIMIMKRNYLLIAAAAAMFAACSNNDTVREVVIPTENVPFSFAAFIGRTDAETEVPILGPPDAKN